MKSRRIVIGTRGSQLALAQSESVVTLLRQHYPEIDITLKVISTHGDRSPDIPLPENASKGLFTADIETALQYGEIDCAVHSLKDLPTVLSDEFTVAAIPHRAPPFDVLVSRTGQKLKDLPPVSRIGTGSLRRSAQLLSLRSDVEIVPLRGNVPTRLAKLQTANSSYDAIVLAAAGLERLGLSQQVTEELRPPMMLPAPGQGALAIECSRNTSIHYLLSAIDHLPTRCEVEAERGFLHALEGGCSLPVAAFGRLERDSQNLHFTGRIISRDGQRVIEVSDILNIKLDRSIAAWTFGTEMAERALEQGAGDLL